MIPQRLPLLAVFTVATVAAVGLLAWWTRGPRQPAGLQFVDPTTGLGLDRVLRCGSPEKFWILENVGSGCALLDANGDGRLDIFLPSPGWVEDNAVTGQGPALYLQLPGGAFEDRTVEAGLTSVTWQTGVAVGDMDNDGNPDLFVSCYGKDQLYRNVGNARFREVSRPMGLTSTGFSSSAVFLDFDRDGYLDLYVAGYVRFKPDLPANGEKPCLQNGVPVRNARRLRPGRRRRGLRR